MKSVAKYTGLILTLIVILVGGLIGYNVVKYQVGINTVDIKDMKKGDIIVGNAIVEIRANQKAQKEDTQEIKQDIKLILTELRK